jgi:hypothetical protein
VKLPKCRHCGKLLVGYLTLGNRAVVRVPGEPATYRVVLYLCPETASDEEPIWVEVQESGERK